MPGNSIPRGEQQNGNSLLAQRTTTARNQHPARCLSPFLSRLRLYAAPPSSITLKPIRSPRSCIGFEVVAVEDRPVQQRHRVALDDAAPQLRNSRRALGTLWANCVRQAIGLVLVSMILPVTISMVSRFTNLAQVTGWPTRCSTSRATPPLLSVWLRMREGQSLAVRAVHLRGRGAVEMHQGVFGRIDHRVGDEARHVEGIGKQQHGERRVDVALAPAHEAQVVELAEGQAAARVAHAVVLQIAWAFF